MRTSARRPNGCPGMGEHITFDMQPGANPHALSQIRPYNERLGYSYMPFFIKALAGRRFHGGGADARLGRPINDLMKRGLYPIYHPKTVAGLTLYDRYGRENLCRRLSQPCLHRFRSDSAAAGRYAAVHRKPRTAERRPRHAQSCHRMESFFLCRRSATLRMISCPALTPAAAARSRRRSKNSASRRKARPAARGKTAPDRFGHPCASILTAPIRAQARKKSCSIT